MVNVTSRIAGRPLTRVRLSRYRRLNIIFGRSKEHLIAFVEIDFISTLALRLKRLVARDLTGWLLQRDTKHRFVGRISWRCDFDYNHW
jgi:hypothetical protein